MKNIAFITPWPPQRTTIAEYTFGLVKGLMREGNNITVFTNYENPTLLEGVSIDNRVVGDILNMSDYDEIIYMIGNEAVDNLYILNMLKKFGGVVHIHDLVMNRIIIDSIQGINKLGPYINLIIKWYGLENKDFLYILLTNGVLPWDGGTAFHFPLFEEVIQYADATIVTSEFMKRKISDEFPHMRVYKVLPLYEDFLPNIVVNDDHRGLNISVYIDDSPQNRADKIIEAFYRVNRQSKKCSLSIIKKKNVECTSILKNIQQLDLGDFVYVYEDTGKELEMQFFQKTDVFISINYPSLGESSPVVIKALQTGTPVIVNNIGWYSELPEFVDKIPFKYCEEFLFEIILRYMSETDVLRQKKEDFLKYAREVLNFEKSINKYNDILYKEFNYELNSNLHSNIGKQLEQLNFLEKHDSSMARNIIEKLIDVF